MSGGAYVGSFEAVRDFRAALVAFIHEAREALTAQDMEIRRTLDWLLDDEPKRWQQIVRQCEERVVQAKIELERCLCSKMPGGEQPSCADERKALERARREHAYAEQKVEAVRKWGRVVDHEASEYSGRAAQLHGQLDVELAAAVAMLDRSLTALEAYATPSAGDGCPTSASISPPVDPGADEAAHPGPDHQESPRSEAP